MAGRSDTAGGGVLRTEDLPLEVVANTGPGRVVVTVTHTKDYSNGDRWGSPYLDTLLPGAGLVIVP